MDVLESWGRGLLSNHEALSALTGQMLVVLGEMGADMCRDGRQHDVHFLVSQQIKLDGVARTVKARVSDQNSGVTRGGY